MISLSTQVHILGSHFGLVPRAGTRDQSMEYKGVEYSAVQLTDDTGWRWAISFDDGKNKSGVTRVSREVAIKIAKYEIDLALKDKR